MATGILYSGFLTAGEVTFARAHKYSPDLAVKSIRFMAAASLFPLERRLRGSVAYAVTATNTQPSLAIRHIEWALRQDPNSPNLIRYLALQQLRLGDLKKADALISRLETLSEKGWMEADQLRKIRQAVALQMRKQ